MLGYMAIGLAAVVGVGPAALAQDSRVLDHCKSAGPGIEADEGQTKEKPGNNTGVFVAVPIGRVCVGPESVDGEPSYVRRITAKEGMAIVEVSTTPFMPDLPSGEVGGSIGRPDQPAGW
jgi:hypothetical protein